MKAYRYIIIGGGMTGDSAAKGIRELDQEGTILMVSREKEPPYNRPPLTKSLWKDKDVEEIWRGTQEKNVDLLLETEIRGIDLNSKKVIDQNGHTYQFDKLLLATGGDSKKLPFGGNEIIYYRTIDDYRKVKKHAQANRHFAIIGSGFIGSELSAGLAMNDKEVKVFDTGPGIAWRIFPQNVVDFFNDYYEARGVELFPNAEIVDVKKTGDRFSIVLEDGKRHEAEVIVGSIGIEPDVQLAQAANLDVGDGILVDEYLRTLNMDVFAAGDVANFYNPLLDRRIRVEHEDNANAMGKQAGRNMAGAGEQYDYLPMFYSDLFDIGYEAVGRLDARLEIVQDWHSEFEKGVLYYLENNRVSGVLLWNVWGKVDAAKELLGQSSPPEKKDLVGRIK